MNEWMFIDHSIDPYMGRSPTGCRARPNTQLKNKTGKTVSGHTTILLLNTLIHTYTLMYIIMSIKNDQRRNKKKRNP
jgi:hypothetical protein